MLYYDTLLSPIGNLFIYLREEQLYTILWKKTLDLEAIYHPYKAKHFTTQIKEYFSGRRTSFSLPLYLEDSTPFQKRVWQELLKIPYGTTVSYQHIAQKIGSPLACRAVGMANHCNKIPIIIPCHRVIAKNGKLSSYAGGLEKKKFLLTLEKNYTP
ncbi:MAG: methylated-DNA--[protein]-cysteine S-methyltransferase [Chitinophagaceae bacterium]